MKSRKRFLKRIKNNIAYIGIRAVIGFFRLMPRNAALAVGSVLGRIAAVLARKEYHLAVEHLNIAFGGEKDESEIRRLAKETFRNLAMNFIDVARLRVMKPEEIRRVCVPHDFDRVRENIAKGKGIIGLTSHTGCWELLGIYLATEGIPTAAIARRLYDSRLEDLLVDTRTKGGMLTISRGRDTRDIIRVLKNGYLLGVLIDQDTKVKGEFVDFFGRPAHTATAPATLSLKYGSPILPVMTYRDDRHRHHICIGEPIEIDITGDTVRDTYELTRLSSEATESFIREHPEQWVWFHKRWKTQEKAGPQNTNAAAAS